MKYFYLIFQLYLAFALPGFVFAQIDNNGEIENSTEFIDKKKWKKIAEKYDYSEKKIIKEEVNKNQKEEKFEKTELPLSPELKNFLMYTLFALVILILVFLGYRFLVGEKFFQNKNISKQNVYTLDEIENNLHEADIDRYLKNAIAAADYRLALRLYYLNLLKILTVKEIVSWKREKTNGAYLSELYGKPIYNDFLKCTEIFEFFWFNEKNVMDEQIFRKIQPFFEQSSTKASQISSPIKAKNEKE